MYIKTISGYVISRLDSYMIFNGLILLGVIYQVLGPGLILLVPFAS